MSEITGVLTSCRRPDLLERTVTSLLQHAPELAGRLIVIEDSEGTDVTPLMGRLHPTIRYVCNGRQMGQLASIDRAYGLVDTDYTFHCEDDWLFYRSGFLAESHRLLEALPRASMVGVRRTGGQEGHDRMVLSQGVSVSDNIAFRWLDGDGEPKWGGYSFNPGLRRLADWRAFGPFTNFRAEGDISTAFRKAGRAIVQLEHSACEHIGEGRHITDPRRKPTLSKRLKRFVRRMKAASGSTDPAS